MNYTLNRVQARNVEANISPRMRMTVTLPVQFDGRDAGVTIYVAVSPFAELNLGTHDRMLRKRLLTVVKQLTIDGGEEAS